MIIIPLKKIFFKWSLQNHPDKIPNITPEMLEMYQTITGCKNIYEDSPQQFNHIIKQVLNPSQFIFEFETSPPTYTRPKPRPKPKKTTKQKSKKRSLV